MKEKNEGKSPNADDDEETGDQADVPDSWDQRDIEPAATEEATPVPAEIVPDAAKDDDIVLGPGGQWGLIPERARLGPVTGFIHPGVMTNKQAEFDDFLAPKAAAWSLPSPNAQKWEFSELTHHGRKKQKAQRRRERRKAADVGDDV